MHDAERALGYHNAWRWCFHMRLTACLLLLLILMTVALAADDSDDEDDVTFKDFTMSLGDRVDVGDFRMELVEVQSVRDGLVVMRISKPGGALDEQRAFLLDSANNFNGGAESDGITVTVTDIIDEGSVMVRIEYKESLGSARKRASERPVAIPEKPKLSVQKSFDKNQVRVGDEVKVTIRVENTGTGQALGITVEDTPPLPEFSYVVGYPPKIKETIDPGQSDSAVYVMNAVKEGSIRVPSVLVTYTDSKKNVLTNSSDPFNIHRSQSRADLVINLEDPAPIALNGEGLVNVSIKNLGSAPASRIAVDGEVKPSEGLVVEGLDRSIFEIQPGAQENYSMRLTGKNSGDYTIMLKASYDGGDGSFIKEVSLQVSVLEQEYKYQYLLLTIPVAIVALWIYRRHREYKY